MGVRTSKKGGWRMNFVEAVREAEKGKKIRIKQWVEGSSIKKFGWVLRSSIEDEGFHSDKWSLESPGVKK